jgi:plastocyanin
VATATAAGTLPTLALTMNGKSITATSSVPAGAVSVVSTVSGEAVGSPTLVRLDPGVTFEQAFGAVISHHGDPNALDGLATIVANPMAPKGTSNVQTVLTPGTYTALDTEADNPAKWPHVNFTVTASSTPATLAKPQATVTAEEFRFTGPSKLHDGELVRFENGGYLYHMVIALPVKNKAGAKAVTAALLTGKDNKAEKLVSGPPLQLMGTVGPGAMHQQVLNAKPGTYVLACFMSTQDGREHTALGMERTITIVK